MTKKQKTQIIRKTIASLEKTYSKVIAPEEAKPVLDQLLESILSLNEGIAETKVAFDLFEMEFVDWNEIRVSAVAEIAQVMKKAGLDPEKARILKAALTRLFIKKNQLSMEFLVKYKEKRAHDFLKGIPGLPDAVINEVMLLSLGHPCFPVTDRITKVCKEIKVAEENEDLEELSRLLSDSIPKTQMRAAYQLFNAYAADIKPSGSSSKKKASKKKAPAKKAPEKKSTAAPKAKKSPAKKAAKK